MVIVCMVCLVCFTSLFTLCFLYFAFLVRHSLSVLYSISAHDAGLSLIPTCLSVSLSASKVHCGKMAD